MSAPFRSALGTEAGGLTRRAWGVLLVLCGALFLDALDVSMTGVALPAIGADLDLGTSSLQWIVSAYVLGFGGFLLLGGRAADLLGRKRVFVVALAVFLLASAAAGLAGTGWFLVAARFVTGVAAAFTAPAGLSIITTSFTEGPPRNRALSIYAATGATGFSTGLVVGGLLTGIGWQWVFFVPVLLGVLVLCGAVAVVPEGTRATSTGGFDVLGAGAVTGAMLLLVFTLVEAPGVGWGTPRTVGSFVGVAALLGAFVLIERTVPAPLLRLGALRNGVLVRAVVGAVALQGGWVGCLFVLTLYAQQVRGWSAIETGLAVAPAGVVVALLAPRIAAPLVRRLGLPRTIGAGLAVAVLAYALLLRLAADSGYATGLLPSFLLIGLAFSLCYGPLTIAATNGVAPDEQGLAGGIVNTAFQIGPALVLATVTAVDTAYTGAGGSTTDRIDGFRAALVVPLVGAVVGVVVFLVRGRSADGPAADPRPVEATRDSLPPSHGS